MHPVEEILPHQSFFHQAFEVLVGGSHDSQVGFNHPVTAHRGVSPPFNGPKQFDLKIEADIPEFIQEQGTAVSRAKNPFLVLFSAGERPLAVAEKLTFYNIFTDSPAVDGHKPFFTAVAQIVNRPGYQLFSGS